MRRRPLCILGWVALAQVQVPYLSEAAAEEADAVVWRSLFNGKDLSGWDTYLGPPHGGSIPIGLNNDPRRVFNVVEIDGAPAIRISGEVYGALTTQEEFENFHFRIEFKWGPKRWPPREHVGRDTGVLYNCVGPHGAGSQAWMKSIECNVMEKGCGQWWSVAGSLADVEGELVDASNEHRMPYKMESPGERLILYTKGGEKFTASPSYGVTPSLDPEKPFGEWNVVEVVCLGSTGIHIVNGKVNLVLTNARYREAERLVPLTRGKLQLQSEGAEVFYRNPQIRSISGIPREYRAEASLAPVDDGGFLRLFDPSLAGGWAQCGPGSFKLEDGISTAHGGMGLWYYRGKMFTNFILRGEFVQEEAGADSGVFVRFPDPGNDPWVAVHKGYEIEIGDDSKPSVGSTGSIYSFQGPTELPLNPPGRWNEYEITCIGQRFYVRLNGKLVNRYTGSRGLRGFIGLQNYPDGKTFRHRELRIRELPEGASAYQVLFEGDLKGWKMCGPGSFELKGGELVSRGGMGLLWHEKPLGDFILFLDWRVERSEDNSGIFVRFPDPGNDPYVAVRKGYEVQIWDRGPRGEEWTGALYSFQAASDISSREAGRWNRCEVEARGQQYIVRLNGRRVNDFKGNRLLRGHVGIQNHDDASRVSFRDIRVVEIEKPD